MKVSGRHRKDEVPFSINLSLAFVSCLLIISALCLIYSLIFFEDYSDSFIANHPSSFEGVEDTKVAHIIVFIALIIRSIVALTWIGSFIYLKRFLLRHRNRSIIVLLAYASLSLLGFIYLSVHAELPAIHFLRIAQVILASILLTLLLIFLWMEYSKRFI